MGKRKWFRSGFVFWVFLNKEQCFADGGMAFKPLSLVVMSLLLSIADNEPLRRAEEFFCLDRTFSVCISSQEYLTAASRMGNMVKIVKMMSNVFSNSFFDSKITHLDLK